MARIDLLAVIDEAVISLTRRPLRTALTCLGTLLGVGVLVAVTGLTASAASQIDARFTAQSSTQVSVTQRPDGVSTRSFAFPADAEERTASIVGVRASGLVWQVPQASQRVHPVQVPGTVTPPPDLDVMALSPAALDQTGAMWRAGTPFPALSTASAAQVAVLGPSAAARLGVTDVTHRPQIVIDSALFTVVGVLADVERHPEVLNSVLVPTSTARTLWGEPSQESLPSLWITVAPGAGQAVAEQVATALSAQHPDRFEVHAPPSPRTLQGGIGDDVESLFLVLAGICLVVGMVGIANTMFVTVLERSSEIGLRRALGGRRAHVAAQFLTEAGVIGLVGGVLGTFLGVAAILATAWINGWTAVAPPIVVLLGPPLGVLTAVVAAVHPALRGARVEPLTALRGTA